MIHLFTSYTSLLTDFYQGQNLVACDHLARGLFFFGCVRSTVAERVENYALSRLNQWPAAAVRTATYTIELAIRLAEVSNPSRCDFRNPDQDGPTNWIRLWNLLDPHKIPGFRREQRQAYVEDAACRPDEIYRALQGLPIVVHS